MATIKLNFSSINAPHKVAEEINAIFKEYAELTDASRYFSAEELEEQKHTFITDLAVGYKAHYIAFLKEQIEEIKPADIHGVYDFGLIREYEVLIERIERL